MDVEELVEWELAGKPKYLQKTRPNTTLSTINPTWPDLGSNAGPAVEASLLSYCKSRPMKKVITERTRVGLKKQDKHTEFLWKKN
jgi:hypothetical protein